jgi:hypothetical protein
LGLRDQFQESIWNLTHNPDTVISRETFNGLGQEYFERLVTEIFNAYKNQFITNMHLLNVTNADEHLWTYPNSVLFATTVITTIGEFFVNLKTSVYFLSYLVTWARKYFFELFFERGRGCTFLSFYNLGVKLF